MLKRPEKKLHDGDKDNLSKVAIASHVTEDKELREQASSLAQELFVRDSKKGDNFINRLLDIYHAVKGKDFLLIHNPGGWGNTPLKHCLQWERSIVEGVIATVERLGYSWLLTQHFRSNNGWWELILDTKEQARFFAFKRQILAAELEFLTRHISGLKVVLMGISQGAVFSNAVMQQLQGLRQVYSIELGIVFLHRSRRVVTERTLAIDSNGLMPDAMMEWDVLTMLKAFAVAPFRWIKYWLEGKPKKLSLCINVPGHEYNWEHPEVRRQIGEFLETNFGTRNDVEVNV
jgi:hypothetical protein